MLEFFIPFSNWLLKPYQKVTDIYESVTGQSIFGLTAILYQVATGCALLASLANLIDSGQAMMIDLSAVPLDAEVAGAAVFNLLLSTVFIPIVYAAKQMNDKASKECQSKFQKQNSFSGGLSFLGARRRAIHIMAGVVVIPASIMEMMGPSTNLSQIANIALLGWILVGTSASHLHDCNSWPKQKRRTLALIS